ncbi:hypothetical protein [Hathewaya limosa]|uniref:Gas vesicle protein n=1 Tax=Hathewaya limosa TaxID=1536 RepID=A0ABU0JRL0_HATLI|nr:hypothetical protein [Hathewaya limosa]AWZ48326.1 hypothetical protein C3495_05615 [Clostridiaceae bacterium 14S0207]MDQ0479713.1 gas vesicle protein [Hathewaya limosa]
MEKSGFFNAVISNEGVPDRSYLAEDFADYFSTFIGNGIFPNPTTKLQVVAIDNDMQVRIKEGKAWINGYKYENTNDRIFILEPADGVLNRIDRLVLRLDFLKREIRSYIKKGEYNSKANSPSLTRNSDMYELALADIQVNAGTIKITQTDITDLRFNKELCGLVHTTVDQIDSTVIFNQFQSWYSNKQSEFDKNIDTWTDKKKKEFETWITQNTQSFLDKLNNFYDTNNKEFKKWFNALKEKLKGDVATNLLNEISATKEEVKDNKKEIDNLKVSIENTDKKIDKIELTAAKVTIKDADNLFSSNDVEGALKEVFTSVDNGKKLLRQAIIDKDNKVSVCTNPSFNDLKNSIGKIKTGYSTGDVIPNDKINILRGFFEESAFISNDFKNAVILSGKSLKVFNVHTFEQIKTINVEVDVKEIITYFNDKIICIESGRYSGFKSMHLIYGNNSSKQLISTSTPLELAFNPSHSIEWGGKYFVKYDNKLHAYDLDNKLYSFDLRDVNFIIGKTNDGWIGFDANKLVVTFNDDGTNLKKHAATTCPDSNDVVYDADGKFILYTQYENGLICKLDSDGHTINMRKSSSNFSKLLKYDSNNYLYFSDPYRSDNYNISLLTVYPTMQVSNFYSRLNEILSVTCDSYTKLTHCYRFDSKNKTMYHYNFKVSQDKGIKII